MMWQQKQAKYHQWIDTPNQIFIRVPVSGDHVFDTLEHFKITSMRLAGCS